MDLEEYQQQSISNPTSSGESAVGERTSARVEAQQVLVSGLEPSSHLSSLGQTQTAQSCVAQTCGTTPKEVPAVSARQTVADKKVQVQAK